MNRSKMVAEASVTVALATILKMEKKLDQNG